MSFPRKGTLRTNLNAANGQALEAASAVLIFMISLGTLTAIIVITGCSAESPPTENAGFEPIVVEPNIVEPNTDEPIAAALPQAEPNITAPISPELQNRGVAKPEPNQAGAAAGEPNVPEPTGAEPNSSEAAAVDSNRAETVAEGPKLPEANAAEPNAQKSDSNRPDEPRGPVKVTFHEKCAPILKKFVNEKGMVDYRKLKLKTVELKELLGEFEKLDHNDYLSWPEKDKIAFWINLYNIQTLRIIADNYPIKPWRPNLIWWPPTDIRHINKVIGGIEEQKFAVMAEIFTLSEIEDRFFRKQFDEPRVFFAICGATLASPPLHNEPYYGERLDQQLDDQVRKFLTDRRGFRIDKKKSRVYLYALLQPSIYGDQFKKKYGTDKKFKDQEPAIRAVLNFIIKYVSRSDASFLETHNYAVRFIKYDWRLNDSSMKR
jgi:hypothetical protein